MLKKGEKKIMNMNEYAASVQDELLDLIRTMAVIPAPSHQEDRRVEFLLPWLEKQGFTGVTVDKAKNVIIPVGVSETNDVAVVMAHTDVVFPDTKPLPLTEDDETIRCPGVQDDTANLAVLLLCARYCKQFPLRGLGMVFVANACEEGLGNLDGVRAVIDAYGSRVKEFLSVDGGLRSLTTRAVGSFRYKVTVQTAGGHSWGKFGNENAIANAASLIAELYTVQVPVHGASRTTYNVGTISGGTSVNTIAQRAEFLYEYRSDTALCLAEMETIFEDIVARHRKDGVDIDVTLLGERPCGAPIPEAPWEELKRHVRASALATTGYALQERAGSTDANLPLSRGIPAATIGACDGVGAHTREEYLVKNTLLPGTVYLLKVLEKYFVLP